MGMSLRIQDIILNGESEGKTFYEVIQDSAALGMQTFPYPAVFPGGPHYAGDGALLCLKAIRGRPRPRSDQGHQGREDQRYRGAVPGCGICETGRSAPNTAAQ
jgi:hypothetical protein